MPSSTHRAHMLSTDVGRIAGCGDVIVFLLSKVDSPVRQLLHQCQLTVREISDLSEVWQPVIGHIGDATWFARRYAHPVLIIDQELDPRQRAAVIGIVMSNAAVVVGPAAADDFMWEAKAQANAMGGIFDIGGSVDVLLRLTASACQAIAQRDSAFRCEQSRRFSSPPLPFAMHEFYGPQVRFLESNKERILGPRPRATDDPPEDNDQLGGLRGVIEATHRLRSDRGRLDAERIRELFTLSRAELARILGMIEETIRQTPDSERLQQPLSAFDRVARLLVLENDPKKFATWLNTANDELDGKTPLDLIKAKRIDVVEGLVHDILVNRGR